MPAMLGVGLVAVLVAAVLVVLGTRAESADRGYRDNLSELTVLAGAMPAQAASAARGRPCRLRPPGRVAHQPRARTRGDRERALAVRGAFIRERAQARRRGGWNTLLDASQQVLATRSVAGDLKKSAGEARATLGRVLAATGNAVSAPGGLAAMRVLPRFETVAQRTSDDLEQLEAAVSPAEVSQRITENTALLSQFLAGLAGLDTTAGVRRSRARPQSAWPTCRQRSLPSRSSSRARSSRRRRSRQRSGPPPTSAPPPTGCRSHLRPRRRGGGRLARGNSLRSSRS
jgi:hypothetical protein